MTAVIALVKRYPIWAGILLLAIGGFIFRDYISGDAQDLRVGDCFDAPAGSAEGTTVHGVQHHPCGDAHEAEVFFVGNISGSADSYPDDATFARYLRDNCLPSYASYSGRDVGIETTYDVGWLYPTTDGWKKGDRGMTCYLYRVDGGRISGSIRAR